MKSLYAEITDINGNRYAANLSELPDAPSSIVTAEKLLVNLRWLKVNDDMIINMEHVVLFKVKEIASES